MTLQLFHLIVAIVSLSKWFAIVEAAPAEKGSEIGPYLMSLGTIEGKTYFYDKSRGYSWNAAKSYCEGIGLRLATIMTSTQQEFLKSKYAANGFSGRHWFAARDAQTIKQFIWESDQSELPSVGQTFRYNGVLTCLYYYADSRYEWNGLWVTNACATVFSNVYVLCETT